MSSLKHCLFTLTTRRHLQLHRKNILQLTHTYATKAEKRKGNDRKVGPKIDSSAESIAAKGFLRPQKQYTPPEDLIVKLNSIFERNLGTTNKVTRLDDLNKRFAILTACSNEFQHHIPNSLLHTVQTLEDVEEFYSTPVCVVTPYDKLQSMELPPNLHVQHDYVRYNPDTDTKWGGVTAFPQSSNIVSGLKYKDKYKSRRERESWPFNY